MDLASIYAAILLGLVEGITEFLPVSSTGHMILVIDVLKLHTPPGKVFEVAIQLGAILAVCIYYRRKLWHAFTHVGDSERERHFLIDVFLAFLPAAVVGLLTHQWIKQHLFRADVVAIALIIGGIAILLIERYKPAPRVKNIDAMSLKTALLIGIFQLIALIPGVSRSGATIMGALLLGVDRKAATEFSFYLAIPTLGAASLFDLITHWEQINQQDMLMIATGSFFAFLSALLVIRVFVDFVAHHGFGIFAWYRIALGSILLLLVL